MHPHRSARRPSIAIVGGETLLGKEVHDLLEARKLNVSLVASESPDTILTQSSDEPLVISSLEAADLTTAGIVILAAPKESALKVREKLHEVKPAPVIIDLAGSLEDLAESRLRAPMVERIAGTRSDRKSPVQTIAHPAAIAIALLLAHLRKTGAVRRSVIEVFEPASERGRAGIDEMQKQTVALLSFKPLPKAVFDAQASFNMLSEFGEESQVSLEEIELKIDRHLASLLASPEGDAGIPMPSLRLIQAPVFHGYSICVWIEFEESPGMDRIFEALGSSDIDVRTKDHEPPTNIGVAGQSGITVGSIAQDRNQPRAWWFWVVADNLQVAAENAGEVVREYLE
jgi:aspartate-semialdehyde dehydrogenase